MAWLLYLTKQTPRSPNHKTYTQAEALRSQSLMKLWLEPTFLFRLLQYDTE